ncbi:MAG TPA: hypothetical protein VF043_04010 [Ktedonobacteraceae bacterium]
MTTISLLKVVSQLGHQDAGEGTKRPALPTGNVRLLHVLQAQTQRGEQHESERSSTQQFFPLRTPGGLS